MNSLFMSFVKQQCKSIVNLAKMVFGQQHNQHRRRRQQSQRSPIRDGTTFQQQQAHGQQIQQAQHQHQQQAQASQNSSRKVYTFNNGTITFPGTMTSLIVSCLVSLALFGMLHFAVYFRMCTMYKRNDHMPGSGNIYNMNNFGISEQEWDDNASASARGIMLICESNFVNLTLMEHLILGVLVSILSIFGRVLVYWIEVCFYSFCRNVYVVGFSSKNLTRRNNNGGIVNIGGFSLLRGEFETIEDAVETIWFFQQKFKNLMKGKLFVVLQYISPFLLTIPVTFYYILSRNKRL